MNTCPCRAGAGPPPCPHCCISVLYVQYVQYVQHHTCLHRTQLHQPAQLLQSTLPLFAKPARTFTHTTSYTQLHGLVSPWQPSLSMQAAQGTPHSALTAHSKPHVLAMPPWLTMHGWESRPHPIHSQHLDAQVQLAIAHVGAKLFSCGHRGRQMSA
jgi:hypothetical protein